MGIGENYLNLHNPPCDFSVLILAAFSRYKVNVKTVAENSSNQKNFYLSFPVVVKPSSRKAKIEISENGEIKVWINAPAIEGQANLQLLKILAKALGLPHSKLEIVKGEHARNKVVCAYYSFTKGSDLQYYLGKIDESFGV